MQNKQIVHVRSALFYQAANGKAEDSGSIEKAS